MFTKIDKIRFDYYCNLIKVKFALIIIVRWQITSSWNQKREKALKYKENCLF